jgi:hypothetical protein
VQCAVIVWRLWLGSDVDYAGIWLTAVNSSHSEERECFVVGVGRVSNCFSNIERKGYISRRIIRK